MHRRSRLGLVLLPVFATVCLRAQVPATSGPDTVATPPELSTPLPGPSDALPELSAPLPDPRTLLLDVERNEKRLEALRKEYTYHVHLEQDELSKEGGLKKREVTDAESLTIQGVRVDRTVARNGKPLTAAEAAKEDERLDKEVARAHERRAKAAGKGEETDSRGDTLLSTARILELGSFTNERRIDLKGRPTIILDYAGDPKAKTHSAVENVVKDLVGTVWVDERDRVLVGAEGRFLNDFKVGGGLLADVHKGTSFHFDATRVGESVWLPATVHGEGSVRLLLFAGLNGRLNLVTSDYKRFHASATILPGESKVDANGDRVPAVESSGPALPAPDPAIAPQRP